GKVGIAAGRWDFEGMQDRGFGRHIDICHVGVPDGLAVAQISDWLAIFDNVGNNIELRMFFVERLSIGVWARWIEFAEVLAECNELRVRERLSVEHHNKAFVP